MLTATDSDGDTLTYTLEGTDAASFDLVTTTDPAAQIRTRTGVTYNHEDDYVYTVVVKADDSNGGTDTVTVAITVTDEAEAPGRPAAPTLTAVSNLPDHFIVEWLAPTNTGPEIDTYGPALPEDHGVDLDQRSPGPAPARHRRDRGHYGSGCRHGLPGAGARDKRRGRR